MFREVKVLVVEDNTADRALFRRLLSAMTFDVDTCGSLTEGIDRVQCADILVIDLLLPNGDGKILLERWTELHKGPAVVISGFMDQERENELLASRAWNVLRKPLDQSVFQAVMQRYGENITNVREFQALKKTVKHLENEVKKARRLAWTLAIVAAAAGMGSQPLLAMIGNIL